MPEILSTGVLIADTGFSENPIAGVPTSVCAFVGPTRKGPVGRASKPLTSFAEFERRYGSVADLKFTGDTSALHRRNYMAHAAQAFFGNGGTRLYVVRTVCGFRKSTSFPAPGSPDFPAAVAAEYTAAFARLEALGEVSIVAAPGYSALADLVEDSSNATGLTYRAIQDALLAHVTVPSRYRMALLDAPPGLSADELQELRGTLDSAQAALYCPWVVIANPLFGSSRKQPAEIALPPSGFVAGIFARNDIDRGVHKAPANLEVLGALRFERNINSTEQETLNELGVNCLRAFTGRGLRVWGARTVSNDPEWKYVNVRRYFAYVSASIEQGLQWTVFEPNGEALWARVRDTVRNFLRNQWQTGALLGNQPDDAWFVRCDRTTMTADDITNGRLICEIGMAPLKPAEFVVIRIGLGVSNPDPDP
jgi:uncharacterized protein